MLWLYITKINNNSSTQWNVSPHFFFPDCLKRCHFTFDRIESRFKQIAHSEYVVISFMFTLILWHSTFPLPSNPCHGFVRENRSFLWKVSHILDFAESFIDVPFNLFFQPLYFCKQLVRSRGSVRHWNNFLGKILQRWCYVLLVVSHHEAYYLVTSFLDILRFISEYRWCQHDPFIVNSPSIIQ